jgi:hypothetical protein
MWACVGWNGLVACVGRGVVVALQATKYERTNKSGDHMSGASEISITNAANAVELESPKFYYFCHEPGYYM